MFDQRFNPKPEITAYEVAIAMLIIDRVKQHLNYSDLIKKSPNIMDHFRDAALNAAGLSPGTKVGAYKSRMMAFGGHGRQSRP